MKLINSLPWITGVILLALSCLLVSSSSPNGRLDEYVTFSNHLIVEGESQQTNFHVPNIQIVEDMGELGSYLRLESGRVHYVQESFKEVMRDIGNSSNDFIVIPTVAEKKGGIDNDIGLNTEHILSFQSWDGEWAASQKDYTLIELNGGYKVYCLKNINKFSKTLNKVW